MSAVLVIAAHPDLSRSRVNRVLLAAARDTAPDAVTVRDLYALYPDYLVDVDAEQAALSAAHTVVWLHPLHWYAMPALMKLWIDDVLAHGWAYGHEGTALRGKQLLLAVTTGGTEATYQPGGTHEHPFESFLPPYRQTAALCGMRFLPPRVVHGAHRLDEAAIAHAAESFAAHLRALAADPPRAPAPHAPTPAPGGA